MYICQNITYLIEVSSSHKTLDQKISGNVLQVDIYLPSFDTCHGAVGYIPMHHDLTDITGNAAHHFWGECGALILILTFIETPYS